MMVHRLSLTLLLALVVSMPSAMAQVSFAPSDRVAFSSDGAVIVTVTRGYDRGRKLFYTVVVSSEAGDGRRRFRERLGGDPTSIAISPDGRTIAVGMLGERVVLLDAAGGKVRKTLQRRPGDAKSGYRVSFVDSDTLVTAPFGGTYPPRYTMLGSPAADRSARIWSVSQGRARFDLGPAQRVVVSARNVAAINGEVLTVFDSANGRTVRKINRAGLVQPSFPDERTLLYVDVASSTVRRMDLASGASNAVAPVVGRAKVAVASPDFRYLAARSGAGDFTMFSLPSGSKIATVGHYNQSQFMLSRGGVLAAQDVAGGIGINLFSADGTQLPGAATSIMHSTEDCQWTFDPSGLHLAVVDTYFKGQTTRGACLRLYDIPSVHERWTRPLED